MGRGRPTGINTMRGALGNYIHYNKANYLAYGTSYKPKGEDAENTSRSASMAFTESKKQSLLNSLKNHSILEDTTGKFGGVSDKTIEIIQEGMNALFGNHKTTELFDDDFVNMMYNALQSILDPKFMQLRGLDPAGSGTTTGQVTGQIDYKSNKYRSANNQLGNTMSENSSYYKANSLQKNISNAIRCLTDIKNKANKIEDVSKDVLEGIKVLTEYDNQLKNMLEKGFRYLRQSNEGWFLARTTELTDFSKGNFNTDLMFDRNVINKFIKLSRAEGTLNSEKGHMLEVAANGIGEYIRITADNTADESVKQRARDAAGKIIASGVTYGGQTHQVEITQSKVSGTAFKKMAKINGQSVNEFYKSTIHQAKNKVDVSFEINNGAFTENVNMQMKNLGLTNAKGGRTIEWTKETNFITMLQYMGGDLPNHFLNILTISKGGSAYAVNNFKDQVSAGLMDRARKYMKLLIIEQSIRGSGDFLSEATGVGDAKKVNLIVVNDNRSGKILIKRYGEIAELAKQNIIDSIDKKSDKNDIFTVTIDGKNINSYTLTQQYHKTIREKEPYQMRANRDGAYERIAALLNDHRGDKIKSTMNLNLAAAMDKSYKTWD